MLISVIIPTYNESNYISKALASLQNQQLDHNDALEIIVIDDGSTDDTAIKVRRFSNVKIHYNKHTGPALARNLGAKHARGEILLFLDADMEFDIQFIKHLISPIKAGHVKGTFSKLEYVANWSNPIARSWNWNQNLPPKHRLPKDAPNIGTDFRAILKSEFDRVKGFDDTGYTDTWTLPKKLGYQPVHAPDAIFYHHNPSSLSESFHQARWASKRQYKLGHLGQLITLIKVSLPVSIGIGFYKSLKHSEPIFLPYKIIYDLGTSLGILNLALTGNTSK